MASKVSAAGVVEQLLGGLLVERLEALARRAPPRRRRPAAGPRSPRAATPRAPARRRRASAAARRSSPRARNGVASWPSIAADAVEPARRRALAAGRAGLHVVLRVEVRAGGIGRAHADGRWRAAAPSTAARTAASDGWRPKPQPRSMSALAARAARAPVIARRGRSCCSTDSSVERRHRRQAVHGAALEDRDQDLAPRRRLSRESPWPRAPGTADPRSSRRRRTGGSRRSTSGKLVDRSSSSSSSSLELGRAEDQADHVLDPHLGRVRRRPPRAARSRSRPRSARSASAIDRAASASAIAFGSRRAGRR